MRDFEAITENGAVYERRGDNLYVKGRYFHNGDLKIVPEARVDEWRKTGRIDWEYIRSLPSAEVPVVGECIVAYAFKEWRISTRVETVTQ